MTIETIKEQAELLDIQVVSHSEKDLKMTEIDKKIQEAKNEKQKIKNALINKQTEVKVLDAEIRMMDLFIDELNDLNTKAK
tara:strand:- start:53 stop:295 length:243 start_codon:yes stop_codon:yes gene_type:complete